MIVQLEDTVYFHFGTASPTTGAATDADSTPVVTVAEDGADMGYAPTVTNVATGLYKVAIAATAANGFEARKRYSCYAAATVGGIVGRDSVAEFEVAAAAQDDLATAAALAVVSAKTTNLPSDPADASDVAAAISSAQSAILAKLPSALVGGKMDSTLAAAERNSIASALLDLADGVETTYTVRQTLRLMAAVLLGKTSGGPGGTAFRSIGDTADRVVATTNTDGDRSVVTLTP